MYRFTPNSGLNDTVARAKLYTETTEVNHLEFPEEDSNETSTELRNATSTPLRNAIFTPQRSRKMTSKNALFSEEDIANTNIINALINILGEQKQQTRYTRKSFELKEKMLKLKQDKYELQKEKFNQKKNTIMIRLH